MYHYGQQFRAGVGITTMYASWDFETYSEAGFEFDPVIRRWGPAPGLSNNNKGLTGVGVYNYVTHPSFDILSLKYDLLDGKGMRFWRPVMTEFGLADEPHDLIAHIRARKILSAFNSGFEAGVWNWHCSPKYGWPPILLSQERCTMAKAKASAYPAGLDDVGNVLKLVNKKDPYGEYLIKLLTVPKNPGDLKKKPPKPKAEPPPYDPVAAAAAAAEYLARVRANNADGYDDDIPF